jgi:MFS family permease
VAERIHPNHFPLRLIVAGIVGNVMEWYDFAVYGYFAATIGRQFFPSDDPSTSLIAAFGAFAAGFLMRPLGGIVFGHIGDHFGRRAALTLSVLAMAIPTFLIGVLPGHQVLGTASAVLRTSSSFSSHQGDKNSHSSLVKSTSVISCPSFTPIPPRATRNRGCLTQQWPSAVVLGDVAAPFQEVLAAIVSIDLHFDQ